MKHTTLLNTIINNSNNCARDYVIKFIFDCYIYIYKNYIFFNFFIFYLAQKIDKNRMRVRVKEREKEKKAIFIIEYIMCIQAQAQLCKLIEFAVVLFLVIFFVSLSPLCGEKRNYSKCADKCSPLNRYVF